MKKILISISCFLFLMGISTLSFSQYQTIGDEADSLSVTEGDLRELNEDQPIKYQHKHKTDKQDKLKSPPSSPENARDGLTHRYKPAQKRE